MLCAPRSASQQLPIMCLIYANAGNLLPAAHYLPMCLPSSIGCLYCGAPKQVEDLNETMPKRFLFQMRIILKVTLKVYYKLGFDFVDLAVVSIRS